MNSINLTGTIVGENPIILESSSGMLYCKFTISVRRKYADKYDFINCVAYRNTASHICKFFKRGDYISILGELHIDKFYNKDGKPKYNTSVSVESVSFCSSKTDYKLNYNISIESNEDKELEGSIKSEINYDFDEDDLPF